MVTTVVYLILTISLTLTSCAMDSNYYKKLDYDTKIWIEKADINQKETFKILIKNQDCVKKFGNVEFLQIIDNIVIIKTSKQDLEKVLKLNCVIYIEKVKKIDLQKNSSKN